MDVNEWHWNRLDVTIASIELSDFCQSPEHFPDIIHIARMERDKITHLLRRHGLGPGDGNTTNVILVASIDTDGQVDCLEVCIAGGAGRRRDCGRFHRCIPVACPNQYPLHDPFYDPLWAEIADLNVVEVYVGYLRRKIDVPFGRNALQTVRGAGYRLAADGG